MDNWAQKRILDKLLDSFFTHFLRDKLDKCFNSAFKKAQDHFPDVLDNFVRDSLYYDQNGIIDRNLSHIILSYINYNCIPSINELRDILLDRWRSVKVGEDISDLTFFFKLNEFDAKSILNIIADNYHYDLTRSYFSYINDFNPFYYTIPDTVPSNNYLETFNLLAMKTKKINNRHPDFLPNIKKMAFCLQKIGKMELSLNFINIYEHFSQKNSPSLLIIRGKCFSQLGQIKIFQDYSDRLITYFKSNHPHFSLSSLLWRAAILNPIASDALRYIDIHRSEANSTYQIANNNQCLTIIDLFTKKDYKIRHKDDLYNTFLRYRSSDNTEYFNKVEYVKCIASNLLYLCITDYHFKNFKGCYRKLFFAKELLAKYNVYANEEAMSEINFLMKLGYPEIYSLLITNNISPNFTKNYNFTIIYEAYSYIKDSIKSINLDNIIEVNLLYERLFKETY